MAEYIKREAVYTAFANAGTDVLERASELIYIAGFSYEYVIEILDDIPAADVAPVVHGRWGKDRDFIKCSACGFGMYPHWCRFMDGVCVGVGYSEPSYCPNCGAKMDEVSE